MYKDSLIRKNILERIEDCYKILSTDGKLLYMNTNGLCQMEIEDFQEVEGKYWWEFWGEEYESIIKNAIDEAKKGKELKFTAFCNTAKGTPKWWEVSVSPIILQNGEIIEIISISKEITENIKQKDEITSLNNKLLSGLEIARLEVGEIDYVNNIIFLPDSAALLYGLEPKKSFTRDEVHDTFHPDYKHDILNHISDSFNIKEDVLLYEHPVVHSNGTLKWVRVQKRIKYSENNQPLSGIMVINDITDEKDKQMLINLSEERFRNLANSIPQLAWIMDPTGYINWYNERWYKYTGTTYEEMKGWGWQKVHHIDSVNEITQKFKEAIENGKEWEDTFRLKSASGEYRWFLSRAIPIKDDDDKIALWFGTNTDITNEIQLREQLNELNISLEQKVAERTKELILKNNQLKERNEELQNYNYITSHDLQEPIRKIQIYLSRAYEEDINESTKALLDQINASAIRVRKLLIALMNFGKFGELQNDIKTCELQQIFQNVLFHNRAIIDESDLELHISLAHHVKADSGLLERLFENLLLNSIKYRRKDVPLQISVTSEIATVEEVEKSDLLYTDKFICITFKDNGLGFEPAYADKIFGLFQRLHKNLGMEGTGVGLAICKKIILSLGGHISATAQVGQGATFKILLPAAT